MWQFTAGWILVQSHHCHLKTTQALKHSSTSDRPKKQALGKVGRETIGNDTHMDSLFIDVDLEGW